MLIFLQFIWSDMDYAVHICAYLCISVHICAYVCISNSTYIWLGEQQNWEHMQLEGFVFTESRTAKGNSSVKQDRWHGQWAKSWPRSWCKRGGCQILARHPCCRYHIHSMLPSCSSWSRGWSQYFQLAQEAAAVDPGCLRAGPHTPPGLGQASREF